MQCCRIRVQAPADVAHTLTTDLLSSHRRLGPAIRLRRCRRNWNPSTPGLSRRPPTDGTARTGWGIPYDGASACPCEHRRPLDSPS
jgi:hypothetical protein